MRFAAFEGMAEWMRPAPSGWTDERINVPWYLIGFFAGVSCVWVVFLTSALAAEAMSRPRAAGGRGIVSGEVQLTGAQNTWGRAADRDVIVNWSPSKRFFGCLAAEDVSQANVASALKLAGNAFLPEIRARA